MAAGSARAALPEMGADIWLGCGVAAAISAAFHAPIAGIIFAHEAILRHFSARAAARSISAISASAFSAWLFGGDRILAMSAVPEDILPHLPILLLAGIMFALVAILINEDEFLVYRPPEQAQLLPRAQLWLLCWRCWERFCLRFWVWVWIR